MDQAHWLSALVLGAQLNMLSTLNVRARAGAGVRVSWSPHGHTHTQFLLSAHQSVLSKLLNTHTHTHTRTVTLVALLLKSCFCPAPTKVLSLLELPPYPYTYPAQLCPLYLNSQIKNTKINKIIRLLFVSFSCMNACFVRHLLCTVCVHTRQTSLD